MFFVNWYLKGDGWLLCCYNHLIRNTIFVLCSETQHFFTKLTKRLKSFFYSSTSAGFHFRVSCFDGKEKKAVCSTKSWCFLSSAKRRFPAARKITRGQFSLSRNSKTKSAFKPPIFRQKTDQNFCRKVLVGCAFIVNNDIYVISDSFSYWL